MSSLQIPHLAALVFYTKVPVQRQGGPVAQKVTRGGFQHKVKRSLKATHCIADKKVGGSSYSAIQPLHNSVRSRKSGHIKAGNVSLRGIIMLWRCPCFTAVQ